MAVNGTRFFIKIYIVNRCKLFQKDRYNRFEWNVGARLDNADEAGITRITTE
jgi:hypothetical protein